METHVQKWGNSLAVRLPKSAVEKLKLHAGSRVRILSKTKELVIQPAVVSKPTFEDLVGKITPENRHKLVDWGRPMGKEIW